jgi:hypothetical protein
MNSYPVRLAFEACIVGAVLASMLVAADLAMGPASTLTRTLVRGFIIGIIIHLGFEIVGGNTWYCTHGAACMKK